MSAACCTGNQRAETLSWAEQPMTGCRSAATAAWSGKGHTAAMMVAAAMAAAMMAGFFLILQIGVLTPISLFSTPLTIAIASTLLLVGLVLLIGLTLSGLVSLTGLSLVTLTTGLTPGTPRGE